MSRTRTSLAVALAGTLVLVACSSDDSGPAAPTTAAAATTVAPTSSAAPTTTVAAMPTTSAFGPGPYRFDARGPYGVGVRTLDLGAGKVEVYYPADPAAVVGRPTDRYSTLDLFPEVARPMIPAALDASFDVGAVRDVAPVPGAFPVVLYSHGAGGYRQAASFLLAHLASWGFVAAAPDHPERGLIALATGGAAQAAPDADIATLRATVELLRTSAAEGGPLAGALDLEHLGIVGHSAGAQAAARLAVSDADIDAFVSISGGPAVSVAGTTGVAFATAEGLEPGSYPLTIEEVRTDGVIARYLDEPSARFPLTDLTVPVGPGSITLVTMPGTTLTPGVVTVTVAVPAKPGLVVAASGDIVVPPARSRALYDQLGSPKDFVEIEGAGHASFVDACPQVLARGGLEIMRPFLGRLVDLVQNGCTATDVDPLLVQQVLDHYVTAFLLTHLGGQDQTATLGADAVHELGDIRLTALLNG